jgi:NTP pyrophosphatase (non-canonical NTP hydrolase)
MTFDDYQKQALKTVLPSSNNLPYTALGLTSEAGEVATRVKKWIRDGSSDPKNLDKVAISKELGDALWYISVIAHQLGLNLDEVAQGNISKLADRQKRGVLGGNGDNR